MEAVPDFQLDQFSTDSAGLRERIAIAQSDIDEYIAQLKKLLGLAKNYIQTGLQFSKAGHDLSSFLASFKVRPSESQETFTIVDAMQKFSSATKSIEDSRQKMLKECEHHLVKPIEFYMNHDYVEYKFCRKKYEKSRTIYDNYLEKYLSSAKKDRLRQDLEDHRLHFADETFSLGRLIIESQKKKRFELLESLSKCTEAMSKFALHESSIVSKLSSNLQEKEPYCNKERELYDKFRMEASNKRRMTMKRQKSVIFMVRSNRVISKEGHLNKKSRNLVKEWNRRFFVVRNGQLFYYRSIKDAEPQGIINLLLSTVKDASTSDHPHCLEVVSNERSLLLQAENAVEHRDWITVIQNTIALMLESQMARHTGQPGDESDPLSVVRMAHPSNSTCAECRSPDPDWVSLNLGILVCIECSGIHRSLGVHISKVRSLTLDRFDPNVINYLCKIGNEFANSVWDPASVATPRHLVDRASKKLYITQKYVNKAYVIPSQMTQHEQDQEFGNSIKRGDLQASYRLLACGAQVDSTPPETSQTSLALAIHHSNLLICDFLLLNDADLSIQDPNGLTPIHLIIQKRNPELLSLVLSRGGKPDQPCGPGPHHGLSPLEYAQSIGAVECVEILKAATLPLENLVVDLDVNTPPQATRKFRSPTFDGTTPQSPSGSRSRPASTAITQAALESLGFFKRHGPHD